MDAGVNTDFPLLEQLHWRKRAAELHPHSSEVRFRLAGVLLDVAFPAGDQHLANKSALVEGIQEAVTTLSLDLRSVKAAEHLPRI